VAGGVGRGGREGQTRVQSEKFQIRWIQRFGREEQTMAEKMGHIVRKWRGHGRDGEK